jgi:hypothetical protein
MESPDHCESSFLKGNKRLIFEFYFLKFAANFMAASKKIFVLFAALLGAQFSFGASCGVKQSKIDEGTVWKIGSPVCEGSNAIENSHEHLVNFFRVRSVVSQEEKKLSEKALQDLNRLELYCSIHTTATFENFLHLLSNQGLPSSGKLFLCLQLVI